MNCYDLFPHELWQYIFDFCDIITQLHIKQTCKNLYTLRITDLVNVPKYTTLTNNIIRKHRYVTHLDLETNYYVTQKYFNKLRNITFLNLTDNHHIHDLSNILSLKTLLIAGYHCAISDAALIHHTQLRHLQIDHNIRINNLRHLTNLSFLSIDSSSITQDNITSLNLRTLLMSGCRLITNLNHMSLLQKLDIAGGNTLIHNSGLSSLYNLKCLNACDNHNITTVSHFTNLTDLSVSYNCGVSEVNIKSLKILNITNNPRITDLNSLTNLIDLTASYNSGLHHTSLHNLNLTRLDLSHNYGVSDISWMTNLRHLDISWNSAIGNHVLKNIHPEYLDISYNSRIKDINHMHLSIKTLLISGNRGITFEGLYKLNPLVIFASYNINIISYNFMSNLTSADLSWNPLIRDDSINLLTNLTCLDISNCQSISNINTLTRLETLTMTGACGVTNFGLSQLHNITDLCLNNNTLITDIQHMTLLTRLSINYNCAIEYRNIMHLPIKRFSCINNNSFYKSYGHVLYNNDDV